MGWRGQFESVGRRRVCSHAIPEMVCGCKPFRSGSTQSASPRTMTSGELSAGSLEFLAEVFDERGPVTADELSASV